MSLTVACVFVQGPYPYTAEYVYRLERMVRRHLERPFHFVCLTDRPELLPGIKTIRIDASLGSPESFGYWTKLRLFDPSVGLTGRVLYLDLDVLVVSDLEEIVSRPSSFSITEDQLSLERAPVGIDRYGRIVVRNFNSSVMAFTAGRGFEALFTEWRPEVSKHLSTDQDWIALRYPNADSMPCEWFPRIGRVQPPWPPEAKVVLCKKPKNHEAVLRWPELEQWWGAA